MRKRSEAGATETEGQPLAEAAAEAADEATQKRVTHMTFDSANRPKGGVLHPEFEQIVESIVVTEITATYQRLEKSLRIGEKRSERGVMLKALDNAESNARLAHRLWMTAKIEYARWEMDNEAVFSTMWAEASRVLQKEKEQGARSKQITDADVKAMVAELHPDEYKHQEVKRVRVKAMVASCENLVENWNQRCRSLNTMLGKER